MTNEMEDTDVKKLIELLAVSQPRVKFDVGQIVSLISVIGMIGSVFFAWGITSQRLDILERTSIAAAAKADEVPQIKDKLATFQTSLNQLGNRIESQSAQLAEIHDFVIMAKARKP